MYLYHNNVSGSGTDAQFQPSSEAWRNVFFHVVGSNKDRLKPVIHLYSNEVFDSGKEAPFQPS